MGGSKLRSSSSLYLNILVKKIKLLNLFFCYKISIFDLYECYYLLYSASVVVGDVEKHSLPIILLYQTLQNMSEI